MPKHAPIPLPKHPPWLSQILVIRALLARETATRFGQYKFGLFWMLLEPLLGVIIMGVIIGGIAERSVPEINYSFFLLQGMLLLKLFSGSLNCGLGAIGSNRGLLVYPAVKPLDPFLARFTFELLTTIFAFLVFCAIAMWIGIRLSLADLHVLAACYLLTWLTGCGFGLVFGVAAAYYPEAEKVAAVFQRPLLFISAVLVPTAKLPGGAQEALFLNPLVHTIELSRKSLFPHYAVGDANLLFPFIFAIVCLSIGLTLFHNHRNFMTQI